MSTKKSENIISPTFAMFVSDGHYLCAYYENGKIYYYNFPPPEGIEVYKTDQPNLCSRWSDSGSWGSVLEEVYYNRDVDKPYTIVRKTKSSNMPGISCVDDDSTSENVQTYIDDIDKISILENMQRHNYNPIEVQCNNYYEFSKALERCWKN